VANKLTKRKLVSFYAAIGRFVLTWAEVETFLDLLVIVLRGSSQSLPHQLSGKLRFVRVALQSETAAPYARDVLPLIDEIEALADTRHDYVHGSIIAHAIEQSALTVTMGRLLQPPSKPRRKPVAVTMVQITRTADRLHEIGDQLLDLVDRLNRTLPELN
jgi:hypothetical protein